MIGWILIGAGAGVVIGTTLGWILGSRSQRAAAHYHAESAVIEQIAKQQALAERDDARAQRDRLNERNAVLSQERTQAVAQANARSSENQWLNQQLQEVSTAMHEARMTLARYEQQTAPEKPVEQASRSQVEASQPEQEYVVKKPKASRRSTPASRAANGTHAASEVADALARQTGEDAR